ncbi:MAG: hypothetical protein KDA91_09210 [Planctomycetaceae bacterium]|nr:hypothetical protein [Planctomycetaceae bacterium]
MSKPGFGFRKSMSLLLLTFFATGCGSDDNVAVYPVKGVVLFNGQPMAGGGSISFVPLTSQSGKNAGGVINPDGTFQMTTYVDGDGAMAGTFRVMIMQTMVEEPVYTGDTDNPGAGNGVKPVETVSAKLQIPIIYADPVKSPATVTIEPVEMNELKIELSPQASGKPQFGA